MPCPVCNSPAESQRDGNVDACTFNCLRCGSYQITGTAATMFRSGSPSNQVRANVSSALLESPNTSIDSSNLPRLLAIQPPPVSERAKRLLFYLRRRFPTAGSWIDVDFGTVKKLLEEFSIVQEGKRYEHTAPSVEEARYYLPMMSTSWSSTERELNFLLSGYLTVSRGFLASQSGFTYVITADGWEFLEANTINQESIFAFVAMSFSPHLSGLFDSGIEPGSYAAGYNAFRVDRVDHVNRIDDEIIAGIRKSRFVIADFTEQKNGVYFESGFAAGLGLPVIWCCREDEVDKVHFDTRQYNLLLWKPTELDDFAGRLRIRIEAVVGRGNYSRT